MDRRTFVEQYEQSWHRLLDLRAADGQPRDEAAADLVQAWARAWNQRRDLTARSLEDEVLDDAARRAQRRRGTEPVASEHGAQRPPFDEIVALAGARHRRSRGIRILAGVAGLALAATVGVVVWQVTHPHDAERQPLSSSKSRTPTPVGTPEPVQPTAPVVVPSGDEPGLEPAGCSADAPQQWADLLARAQEVAVPSDELGQPVFTDIVLAEDATGRVLATSGPISPDSPTLETRLSWQAAGGDAVLLARWLDASPTQAAIDGTTVFVALAEKGGHVLHWLDLRDPAGTQRQREGVGRAGFTVLDGMVWFAEDRESTATARLQRLDPTTGAEETLLDGMAPAAYAFASRWFAWVPAEEAPTVNAPRIVELVPGLPAAEVGLPPVVASSLAGSAGWFVGKDAERRDVAIRPEDGLLRTPSGPMGPPLAGDQAALGSEDRTVVIQQLASGSSVPAPGLLSARPYGGLVVLAFSPAAGGSGAPRLAFVPAHLVPRLC